jgi:hypothetical protein
MSHPTPHQHTTPEDELGGSVADTLHDLREVIAVLPAEPAASAKILDRLAEELTEAAAMLRALPGRPPAMNPTDRQLLAALRTSHAAGLDLGATVAHALCSLAVELGGQAVVLANRPGSWEADAIRHLMAGTAWPDDPPVIDGPGAGGSL